MPLKPIGINDDNTFSGRVKTALETLSRQASIPAGGTAGQVLSKVTATDRDIAWTAPPAGVTDHGALTGLTDDDHTQYALADGTRGSFASTAQGVPTGGTTGQVLTKSSDANYATQWQNSSAGNHPTVVMTTADFNALATKDPNTLYFVTA